MKTLSQLITEHREYKKLSLAQLSALTGIKEAHLTRIERGESKPTMPIVFRICKAMDVDPLILADQLAAEFRTQTNTAFSDKPSVSTLSK
ncbi:MAG: helix-turn-helix transcriptional regulator [Bacteroidetes bacterium]|nr:helix-turn-helix transcriptional regulator [Fibrella sp.]